MMIYYQGYEALLCRVISDIRWLNLTNTSTKGDTLYDVFSWNCRDGRCMQTEEFHSLGTPCLCIPWFETVLVETLIILPYPFQL